MAYYLAYLYSKELPTAGYTPGSKVATNSDTGAFTLLAELYILGERQLDSVFRKAVLDEMIRLRALARVNGAYWNPGVEAIKIIYEGTLTQSPARRFMVDISTHSSARSCVAHDSDPAFLYDLTQPLFARTASNFDDYLYLHPGNYSV